MPFNSRTFGQLLMRNILEWNRQRQTRRRDQTREAQWEETRAASDQVRLDAIKAAKGAGRAGILANATDPFADTDNLMAQAREQELTYRPTDTTGLMPSMGITPGQPVPVQHSAPPVGASQEADFRSSVEGADRREPSFFEKINKVAGISPNSYHAMNPDQRQSIWMEVEKAYPGTMGTDVGMREQKFPVPRNMEVEKRAAEGDYTDAATLEADVKEANTARHFPAALSRASQMTDATTRAQQGAIQDTRLKEDFIENLRGTTGSAVQVLTPEGLQALAANATAEEFVEHKEWWKVDEGGMTYPVMRQMALTLAQTDSMSVSGGLEQHPDRVAVSRILLGLVSFHKPNELGHFTSLEFESIGAEIEGMIANPAAREEFRQTGRLPTMKDPETGRQTYDWAAIRAPVNERFGGMDPKAIVAWYLRLAGMLDGSAGQQ